jgi:hypothetical protein
MGPEDYDVLGFAHKPVPAAARYVTRETVATQWVPTLNDSVAARLLDDKAAFADVVRAAGIATPRTLAVYDGAADVSSARQVLAESAGTGVVVKPVVGQRGRGITVFTRLDPDGATGRTIRRRQMSIDRALERASRVSRDGRVLVQQRLRQHSAMDHYAPQRTSGLRLYTLRRRDGSVRLLAGYLRLGRAGAMTDNVSKGALAVHIDLESGALGRGLHLTESGARQVTKHPDRGRRFGGEVLPHWAEVVNMCHEAAGLLDRVALVGWDVMVTETAPQLLEGNWDVRLYITQALQGGLVDDVLIGELADLGLVVPERLPGLVPSLARRATASVSRRRRPRSSSTPRTALRTSLPAELRPGD